LRLTEANMADESGDAAASSAPVSVPHTALASDVLRAVVESFVLREGTDYGERELTLDEKLARVLRLLERGEARIVFDPPTGSVDIVMVRGGRGAAGVGRGGRDGWETP
jgi:uncharacterized protein YheU (UPF0270 family)